MRLSTIASLTLAIAGLALAVPASGQQADRTTEAELLRSLDIMFMVSALRCRNGQDDFQADYQRFAARHLGTMNDAAHVLQDGYALRHGQAQARRQLDRLSTRIANRFGQGHPWLGCAELKGMARNLADHADRAMLLAAANDLMGEAAHAGDDLLARYER